MLVHVLLLILFLFKKYLERFQKVKTGTTVKKGQPSISINNSPNNPKPSTFTGLPSSVLPFSSSLKARSEVSSIDVSQADLQTKKSIFEQLIQKEQNAIKKSPWETERFFDRKREVSSSRRIDTHEIERDFASSDDDVEEQGSVEDNLIQRRNHDARENQKEDIGVVL